MNAETEPAMPPEISPQDPALFDRVVSILEEARDHVARTVNHTMVAAGLLADREGNRRAGAKVTNTRTIRNRITQTLV